MTNVFDYRDSSRGAFANLDFMQVEDTGYLAANNLFYGSGGVSGTYTWFDESLNRFVTSETGMGQSGVIGFGPPIDVLHRDMPGIDLPAAFDESQDFTGLVGGQTAENEGTISAYFRLFGVAMPTLTWDNTAFGMTDAAAAAEYQANLEAAAADYLAQLQAVLAASVRNGIDMVNWLQGGTAAQPGFVLHITSGCSTRAQAPGRYPS